MIYLDTHTVIWTYDKVEKKFLQGTREIINQGKLFVSPAVILELQFLFEIKRIKNSPEVMIDGLEGSLELKVCTSSFLAVVKYSQKETWTRDPFDRMIVAQCRMNQGQLLTKDKLIHKNFDGAVW